MQKLDQSEESQIARVSADLLNRAAALAGAERAGATLSLMTSQDAIADGIEPSVRDSRKSTNRLVLVIRLDKMLLYGVVHVPEDKDGKGRHAPFLLGAQGLVERLPCVGEFLKIGGSLR